MLSQSTFRRFNVKTIGDGSHVLMFGHGYGCDQSMWRFLIPHFSDQYKIVLFDYMGSGRSDLAFYDEERYSSLQAYADDVIDIIQALELKNVTFVGHSVGSIIGLLAGNTRPDLFQSIIMISPSPCYINQPDYFGGFSKTDIDEMVETLQQNYLGWSGAITPVIIGDETRTDLADELNNSFCNMRPDIAKRFAKTTFLSDNSADVAKCTLPVLVVQVEKDVIAPVAVGHWMIEHLQNGMFALLKVVGHCPHMSNPEETAAAVRSFLQQQ